MTWCDPRGSVRFKLLAAAALGCVAIVVAVIVVAQGPAAERPAPRAKPLAFVTRSGTTLLIDKRPFRYSGANIFWGALDTDARTGLNYPTPFRVQSALKTAADMGET